MSEKSLDSTTAYSLKTPEDSVKLYAEWAETYDSGFATEKQYELPGHTARAFANAGGSGLVLDVGAGTGLCGVVLADLGVDRIEATDISPAMLEQAMLKGVYARAITADLTQGLPMEDGTYDGIVSSGTFTTGHIGPDTFDELLRVAKPGALFALSINTRHYESAGFADAFDRLAPQLSELELTEVRIYGAGSTGTHKNDTAFLATFRKA